MKLLALTVATAAVLAFASPNAVPVLAQGHDDGAVGRPLQLDGGPSSSPDTRGQSFGGRSEGTERSAGAARSEENQTSTGKTSETAIRGRSQTSTGSSSERKHRVAIHRGHRLAAFYGPRHRFAIRGQRPIVFHGPRHRFVNHRRGHRVVAFGDL